MDDTRAIAWSNCERSTRQFYRSLDRHETAVIEAMVAEDCLWIRGGNTLNGPAEMCSALQSRDKSVNTRHLVCNAVAGDTEDGNIEVHFDLIYLSDADKTAQPKVLSGIDRYRLADGQWRLIFKQATLQF